MAIDVTKRVERPCASMARASGCDGILKPASVAHMPRRKSLTAAEQAEKFRLAAKKRIDSGMLSVADAEDAVDAKIAKNIRDYGA